MRLATNALVLSVCAFSSVPFGQTKIRSETNVVVLSIAVTDDGVPVRGLTSADFNVFDNGDRQILTQFHSESTPIEIVAMVDESGSMTLADRLATREVVSSIRSGLIPEDRLRVMAFTDIVRPVDPSSNLMQPSSSDSRRSGTALYNAMLWASTAVLRADGRSLVMFVTDGAENSSSFGPETVVRTARLAKIPMTFILPTERSSDTAEHVMEEVASLTGGAVVRARSTQERKRALLSAIAAFRTTYLVAYSPSNSEREGWHEVAVTVTKKGAKVSVRRGYEVPRRASR